VQELCLSVLIFKEGIQRQEDRLQAALRAVTAGHWVKDPKKIWPEYFGDPGGNEDAFPSADADMSDFRWEKPTAEQVAAELEMMMRGAHVAMRDGQVATPPPPREPEASLRPGTGRFRPPPAGADELEWS
jgi:hypothetical protein